YATGPLRSDAGDHQHGSGLLVDGKSYAGRWDTGARRSFEATATGGYVVVDGGTKYRAMGLSSAERHVLADFAGPVAVISTLDRLRASREHIYTFRLESPAADRGGPVATEIGAEAGRPTFTLRG